MNYKQKVYWSKAEGKSPGVFKGKIKKKKETRYRRMVREEGKEPGNAGFPSQERRDTAEVRRWQVRRRHREWLSPVRLQVFYWGFGRSAPTWCPLWPALRPEAGGISETHLCPSFLPSLNSLPELSCLCFLSWAFRYFLCVFCPGL